MTSVTPLVTKRLFELLFTASGLVASLGIKDLFVMLITKICGTYNSKVYYAIANIVMGVVVTVILLRVQPISPDVSTY